MIVVAGDRAEVEVVHYERLQAVRAQRLLAGGEQPGDDRVADRREQLVQVGLDHAGAPQLGLGEARERRGQGGERLRGLYRVGAFGIWYQPRFSADTGGEVYTCAAIGCEWPISRRRSSSVWVGSVPYVIPARAVDVGVERPVEVPEVRDQAAVEHAVLDQRRRACRHRRLASQVAVEAVDERALHRRVQLARVRLAAEVLIDVVAPGRRRRAVQARHRVVEHREILRLAVEAPPGEHRVLVVARHVQPVAADRLRLVAAVQVLLPRHQRHLGHPRARIA